MCGLLFPMARAGAPPCHSGGADLRGCRPAWIWDCRLGDLGCAVPALGARRRPLAALRGLALGVWGGVAQSGDICDACVWGACVGRRGGAWRYRQFGTRSDSRRTRWGGVKSHAMPPAFAGVTCLFCRPKIRTCAGKKTIIIERISGIFGFQVQYMHAKFLALECLYLTVRQSKKVCAGVSC